MKKILSILCFLLPAFVVGALDLETTGSFSNLSFDTARTSSLGTADFEGAYDYGANIVASERIGNNLSFSAGFEREPITKNIVFTRVGFDADFIRLSVGPFFGPFNADGSVLTSGLSTTLRLELPGVGFGSFRSDSTIGAGLAAPGDYVQEKSVLALGFWVPNAVVTGTMASNAFTYQSGASTLTVDESVRYECSVDAFKKGVPYTIKVTAAYETLSRSYINTTAETEDTDELGLALIGFETTVRIKETFRLKMGMEAALYAWGIGTLGSPDTSTFLYRAWAGCLMNLPTKETY